MMLPHHRLCAMALLTVRWEWGVGNGEWGKAALPPFPTPHSPFPTPYPSDRVLAVFAGANTDRFIDREDKYLSVAEFASAGGLDNRVDSVLDDLVVEDDFNLQFRHEFNLVFAAPIDLSMTFLPSEAFDLADGHALHAERLQRVFDAFEQVRTNDRFNLFHCNSIYFFLCWMFVLAGSFEVADVKD